MAASSPRRRLGRRPGVWLVLALVQVSAGSGTWVRGAAMPTARAEVGAAVVDGKIYVVGAFSGPTDANEVYAPASATWQRLAPLARSLNHVCAAAVEGMLYVLGGFDPTAANRPVAATYAFDPATDTWTPRADMPTPRGALTCVALGETIYAIGGTTPAGDTGAVEACDAATDTWRPDLAPMPTPRDHLASAGLDGRVHVIGGRSPRLGMLGTNHEVYDPVADAWTEAAALPTCRHRPREQRSLSRAPGARQ